MLPDRVSNPGPLTRKSGVLGSIPGPATYFRFSFRFSRRAVVSYWRKYVHEVLVNRLGGLSLPRKSVVRLTDRPDMTLDVYRGRKTTIQQQCVKMLRMQHLCKEMFLEHVLCGKILYTIKVYKRRSARRSCNNFL